MKFPSEKEITAVCDFGDWYEIQTPSMNFNVREKELTLEQKKMIRRLMM
jgi:hypothetical protein